MSDMLIVALILVAELAVALAAAVIWLGVRLRRHSGKPPTARDYIADEIAMLDTVADDAADENRAVIDTRREALATELAALDATTDAAREKALAGYAELAGENPGGNDSEDEAERLRRLLQREEQRLGELLELKDEMREVRMGYDRVRHVAAQLLEAQSNGQVDEQTANAYREAEAHHLARLEQLELQVAETVEAASSEAAGDSATASASGATAPAVEELEQVVAMKDKEIEELKAALEQAR
ncbi:hypothetical protein [Arhodomonas sp. AD133]|uniref:hypothetical protein n=1 Tax=Arhodomonas sp. AD133 TaxID=3415009 RepID=UPI003EB96916